MSSTTPPPTTATATEWKEKGNQHYLNKAYEDAATCYTHALELDPEGPTTTYLYYSNRSSCWAQLGRWSEAASDAKKSLKFLPTGVNFPKGYYRLAKACIELRQFGAANEALTRGLAAEPGNVELRRLAKTLEQAKAKELASIKTAKDPRKRVAPSDLQTLEELGQGNFSRILHVVHKETKEHFALKVIEKSQVERIRKRHPNVFNEISMERRILSRLRHANIVELYQAFQDYTTLYLLLEYCEGGVVWQRLQMNPTTTTTSSSSSSSSNTNKMVSVGVPLSLARFYTREVIAALSFLHGKGIVHRDVKPENMGLTLSGRVKLIDFGTAKDLVETDLNGQEFVGTPEYMSPEAIRSKETLMEGDLWALGACVFQFLVGLSPFRAPSAYLIFLRSQRCNPLYPSVIPAVARDLIGQLLQKKAEDRLGSPRSVDVSRRGHAAILAHPFFHLQGEEQGEGQQQEKEGGGENGNGKGMQHAGSTHTQEEGEGEEEGEEQEQSTGNEKETEPQPIIIKDPTPREVLLRHLAAQCVLQAMSTTPPSPDFTHTMHTLTKDERAVVLHLLERQGRLVEPRILRLALLSSSSSSLSSSSSPSSSAKDRLLTRIDWHGHEVYGLGKDDYNKYTNPFFFIYLGGEWGTTRESERENACVCACASQPGSVCNCHAATAAAADGHANAKKKTREGLLEGLQKAVFAINRLRPRVVVVADALWRDMREEGGKEGEVWQLLGRISESIPVLPVGVGGGGGEGEGGRRGGYGFWFGGMRGLVVGKGGGRGERERRREEDWLVEELEQGLYYDEDQHVVVFASGPWFEGGEGEGKGSSGCGCASERLRRWALGKLQERETHLRAVLCPSGGASSHVVEVMGGEEEVVMTSDSEPEEEEEEEEEETEGEGGKEESNGARRRGAGRSDSMNTDGNSNSNSNNNSKSKVKQIATRDACIVEVYRDRIAQTFVSIEELVGLKEVKLAPEAAAGEEEEED